MAQQAAPKSPPNAFLRTSNDSLPSRAFSDDIDSMNAPREIPRRRHVSSASALPSEDSSLFGSTGTISDLELLNGDRTPTRHLSLLELPGSTVPVMDWHSLHGKQEALHDAERSHWRMERKLLQEEIAQLKQKLMITETKLQQLQISDPSRSSSTSTQGESRPPVMGERPSALEKPRSPPSMSNGMPSPLASVSGNAIAGNQQAQQQTTRDVKFASIDSAVSMEPSQKPEQEDNANKGPSIDVYTPNTLHAQETPLSPPPSATMLSPPPSSYVKHAGHTPAKLESMSPGHSPEQRTPTRANSLHNRDVGQVDGADEDRPLKGALCLAPNPAVANGKYSAGTFHDQTGSNTHAQNMRDRSTHHLAGSIPINDLDAKLQEVTEHPEQAVPAVLQHPLRSPSIEASDNGSKTGGSTPGSSSNTPRPIPEPDQGPRLKMKPSMNFGAPLGRIR